LLVTAEPHEEGDVTFLPPNGFASPNYRISVTVRFSSGFDGCAGIYTRGNAAGRYESYLCGDNSTGIGVININAQSESRIFRTVRVRPAPSYTIMTVSDGTSQSLFINGARVGSVVDSEFHTTINVGLVLHNVSGRPESAVFNKFTFTPLPESPHT
jgi:hypothetical protein